MIIKDVEIHLLKPYEKNAKTHTQKQVDTVAKSIQEFGMVQPIVVDDDNVVVIGHCRLEACKQLQQKTVPVVYVDNLSIDQVRALRLIDNKTNESQWNIDKLQESIDEIMNFSFEEFDIDFSLDFDFMEEKEPEVFEDEPPIIDYINPPNAKLGDIYQLGNHRLICEDSTKTETIMSLMDGKQADAVVTDPPYNVNYESKAGNILNDNMGDNQFSLFLTDAFKQFQIFLKPGGAFYIWHADSEGLNFRQACMNNALKVRQCLIWNKSSLVLGRQDYHWKHEPCLYGWKDGAAHYFIDDRSQTTVFEDKLPELSKLTKQELINYIKDLHSDKQSTTIINEPKPLASDEHPTMKPIKLISRLILNSTKAGELVLDTFGGSGSTLISAEQTGRICYMVELDPKYIDVIIKRYENLTGNKAILIKEGN